MRITAATTIIGTGVASTFPILVSGKKEDIKEGARRGALAGATVGVTTVICMLLDS